MKLKKLQEDDQTKPISKDRGYLEQAKEERV